MGCSKMFYLRGGELRYALFRQMRRMLREVYNIQANKFLLGQLRHRLNECSGIDEPYFMEMVRSVGGIEIQKKRPTSTHVPVPAPHFFFHFYKCRSEIESGAARTRPRRFPG